MSKAAPVPEPTWRTRIPVSFSNSSSNRPTIPASIGPMVLDNKMNLLVWGLPKPEHDNTKQKENINPILIHRFLLILFIILLPKLIF
jgi:hypothetical protein